MATKKQWQLLAWASLAVSLLLTWWLASSLTAWLGTLDSGVAAALVTAIAGISGLIYSQWHAKHKDISEGHRPNKIEVYGIFFDIVERFMNEARTAEQPIGEVSDLPEELRTQFTRLNRGMVIWASPSVIRAWLKFREISEQGDPKLLLYVDDVLKAIRKDLGNSNFGLNRGDLIKQYLSDPQELDRLL